MAETLVSLTVGSLWNDFHNNNDDIIMTIESQLLSQYTYNTNAAFTGQHIITIDTNAKVHFRGGFRGGALGAAAPPLTSAVE